FNTMHHKLKFKMEQQSQNKINYLDLTIMTNNNELKFEIYRKPTSTDLILHNTSCDPYEHKEAAINYLCNRINTYKLTNEGKIKEEGIITRILVNNEYSTYARDHNTKPPNNNTPQKDKWTKFTYFGPSIRRITKLFHNTNIKITFKTNNTIKNFLRIKHETTDKYNLCGVYQMTCKDCDLKYVGQTGCNFRTRYKEHIREIKMNGQKSKFAQHILDTTHNYHTIDKAMKILHIEKKGKMLNTLESFHIYELTKQNLQMNEALTDSYNQIYDILIKTNQTQEI
ncbi:hypothetical protein B7P43_G18159, partial [Cryptotermes secundus]